MSVIPRARRAFGLGPAHALKIAHDDQLAVGIAHLREDARAHFHRLGYVRGAEAGIDALEELLELIEVERRRGRQRVGAHGFDYGLIRRIWAPRHLSRTEASVPT